MCCVAYISIPSHKLVYLVSGICMLGGESLKEYIILFSKIKFYYLISAIICSIGLGIYGTSTLNNGLLTPMSLNGPGGFLSWAYFLGIAGVGIAGIISLLYLIDGMVKSGEKSPPKGLPYYYYQKS